MYKLKQKRKKSKERLGYLLDVTYSKKYKSAVLILLDPEEQKIFTWYDPYKHRPYLLTNASRQKTASLLKTDPDYLRVESVRKYNAVTDENVLLTKIVGEDPNAVDSNRSRTFRSILQNRGYDTWEGWVDYVLSYCYDMGLEIGMPYLVGKGTIRPYVISEHTERMDRVLSLIKQHTEITDSIIHWVRLFEAPVPKFKFIALDIEVLPETKFRIPDAIAAKQPIIAVSLVSSDGKKITLVLKREEVELLDDVEMWGEVIFCEREYDLIYQTFRLISDYPVVVTFNGDFFDMMFLYNRARKLHIPEKYNPIYVKYKKCKLKRAIHIDLYHFMKNPSIQNYAYRGSYKTFKLEDIAKAILGREKIKFEGSVGDLPYNYLVNYCLNDSSLVYELCSTDNDSLLNLILMLVRMGNLGITELTRRAISTWVRSTFFYLSRLRDHLIPNSSELMSKGEIQTVAKIKGKKYEGAIVRRPRSGMFFNVTVVDFQSLYPSEVKERNIGFATVNCPHNECKKNKVPDTDHHICIINRAIEAEVIGGLKDARVFFYKGESKNKENPLYKFYSLLEQAIKVYVNAAYGVFGSEKFALYCPPVAESIASYSRRDMQLITDRAERIGADPMYGDTDSVFLNGPTKEQLNNLVKWSTEYLKMDLSIDKTYRYAIFSHRKKNYLGINADGSPDIKGLSGKKKNTPDIVKKPFFEVVEMLGKVETEEDYEKVRLDIIEILRDKYVMIRERRWENIRDLIFNMRLSRDLDTYIKQTPQHVKAGRMLKKMGYDIRAGDDILYIKTKTEQGVMPYQDDFKSRYVNVDDYVASLRSVFEQLIEPMDIDWELHIEDKPSQVKLHNFMYTRE